MITALIAAVPGFIDWAFAIPNGSEAKKTGFLHMALNVSALILFAACAWINFDQFNAAIPILGWSVSLSLMGVALTMCAGFLGWKLVGVHHIGVELTRRQEHIDPTLREAAQLHPLRHEISQKKDPKDRTYVL